MVTPGPQETDRIRTGDPHDTLALLTLPGGSCVLMSQSEWLSCGLSLLQTAFNLGLPAPRVRIVSRRSFVPTTSQENRAIRLLHQVTRRMSAGSRSTSPPLRLPSPSPVGMPARFVSGGAGASVRPTRFTSRPSHD